MQHFLSGLVKTVCSYWDTRVGVFNSYSLNIHVFPAVLFFVKFTHFHNSCVQQIVQPCTTMLYMVKIGYVNKIHLRYNLFYFMFF